jgi:hypothetical protein
MALMSSSTLQRTVRLTPYAPVASGTAQSLEVQIERTPPQTLRLRYVLRANLSRIRIPQPKPAQRADELWKHTCFEAFLRASAGTAYSEVNVAPSSEWALYSFDDYRQGMAPLNVPQPPGIVVERTANLLAIEVQIDLKVLPPSRALALAAVLEDDGGSLSYWAFKHAATNPDFHHPDSFTLEI